MSTKPTHNINIPFQPEKRIECRTEIRPDLVKLEDNPPISATRSDSGEASAGMFEFQARLLLEPRKQPNISLVLP